MPSQVSRSTQCPNPTNFNPSTPEHGVRPSAPDSSVPPPKPASVNPSSCSWLTLAPVQAPPKKKLKTVPATTEVPHKNGHAANGNDEDEEAEGEEDEEFDEEEAEGEEQDDDDEEEDEGAEEEEAPAKGVGKAAGAPAAGKAGPKAVAVGGED